jgi:hypothetical protein
MTRINFLGNQSFLWLALGIITSKPAMKVAFNVCSYVNEYGKWHCLDGALEESWRAAPA